MITFEQYLLEAKQNIAEAGENNTINSRITELYPCALFYLNNKKKFVQDTAPEAMAAFITAKYNSTVDAAMKKYVFKYTTYSSNFKDELLKCIDPAVNTSSPKLLQAKINQAVVTYNKIIDDFVLQDKGANINVYWTATGKPDGVPPDNEGDIFVEITKGKKLKYVAISMKAGSGNTLPPLKNPTTKSFLMKFIDDIDQFLVSISKNIWKNVYSTIFTARKYLAYKLTENDFVNRELPPSQKSTVAILKANTPTGSEANKINEVDDNSKYRKDEYKFYTAYYNTVNDKNITPDAVQQFVNTCFQNARNVMILELCNKLNKLSEDKKREGLKTLLQFKTKDATVDVEERIWLANNTKVQEHTDSFSQFLKLLDDKGTKIQFVPGESKGKLEAQIGDYTLQLEIRSSHSGKEKFGPIAIHTENLFGGFLVPYLDKVAMKLKMPKNA